MQSAQPVLIAGILNISIFAIASILNQAFVVALADPKNLYFRTLSEK